MHASPSNFKAQAQDIKDRHYLAGGDILNVVNGLVAAKKAEIEIPFDKVSRANIKGVDIVKAIENKTLEYVN